MSSTRTATPKDAEQILAIYAPYIENTSITFETEVPALPVFASRIEKYLENWPWLVWDENGEIGGYAYASRYRERTAYQWSIEVSVYIHDNFLRKGIATQLYHSLFSILQMQGYRNVYAVINLPNDRSVTLHESMGFKWFATYEQVGYKLGQWKNVGWWRLIINDFNYEPAVPTPFNKMNNEMVVTAIKSSE
jgi:L-amino acid N-acyltransferase YncA